MVLARHQVQVTDLQDAQGARGSQNALDAQSTQPIPAALDEGAVGDAADPRGTDRRSRRQ